jgi:hypothetical protein
MRKIDQDRADVINSSVIIQRELADIQNQINAAIEAGNQATALGIELQQLRNLKSSATNLNEEERVAMEVREAELLDEIAEKERQRKR